MNEQRVSPALKRSLGAYSKEEKQAIGRIRKVAIPIFRFIFFRGFKASKIKSFFKYFGPPSN